MIASTPHAIPAELPLRGREIPARTDLLEEGIDGVQGFGKLLVVPIGQSLETSFTFGLPATVVENDPQSGTRTYRLTVQKQPGTIAVPLTLRLRLPTDAQVISTSAPLEQFGDEVILHADLRPDLVFEIVFGLSDGE